LAEYEKGDYQAALIIFENVVGLEPLNFMGDNFQMTTDLFRVAQYNVACCYSQIGAIDSGLEALTECLNTGYDGFSKIREDPGLANLRASEEFTTLINKYDEPLFNDNAMKAIKGLFGRFGKN